MTGRVSTFVVILVLLGTACSSPTDDGRRIAELKQDLAEAQVRIAALESQQDTQIADVEGTAPPPVVETRTVEDQPPPTVAPTATPPQTDPTPPPETGSSTRANPVPVGTPVLLGDWEMTVIGVSGGTAEVMAENPSNDPPTEGREFVLIEATLTYRGATSSSVTFNTNFTVVGDSDVAYGGNFDDYCGVIPDELDEFSEVFTGGTVTGNLCYSVRSSDVAFLVLISEEFLFGDDRHFMAIR